MKLEELYKMVMSDRDIMSEFVKASGTDTLSAFAEKYGCNASDSEIRNFFLAQCEGELPDDAVESVAGGFFDFGKWISDRFNSLFGGFMGSGSSSTNTSNTTSSAGKNSFVGGGAVNFTNGSQNARVSNKAIGNAAKGVSLDSISRKM